VLRDCIDAVSIFHQLVNPDVVDWAHRNRLRVLAWTVNDGPRLADLIRDGVDGVTTANLAIVRALDSPTERTSG
jgi:glycerophosphoryl diester phosphodiesterase